MAVTNLKLLDERIMTLQSSYTNLKSDQDKKFSSCNHHFNNKFNEIDGRFTDRDVKFEKLKNQIEEHLKRFEGLSSSLQLFQNDVINLNKSHANAMKELSQKVSTLFLSKSENDKICVEERKFLASFEKKLNSLAEQVAKMENFDSEFVFQIARQQLQLKKELAKQKEIFFSQNKMLDQLVVSVFNACESDIINDKTVFYASKFGFPKLVEFIISKGANKEERFLLFHFLHFFWI